MNREANLSRLWGKQLVSREQAQNLLAHAQVNLLHPWAEQREAAELTLASVLKRAIRRQQQRLKPPPKELTKTEDYDKVVALSQRLEKLLLSLQDQDDPPPLLEKLRSGRNVWEQWAHSGKELAWERRGATANSDHATIHHLAAFYQLSACSGSVQFSRKEDDPAKVFINLAFKIARETFVEIEGETPGSAAHTLYEPNTETFVKRRSEALLRKKALADVTEIFVRFGSALRNSAKAGY